MMDDKYQSSLGGLLLIGLIIWVVVTISHHRSSPVWQANYETTTSEAVFAGPTFGSESACLGYIHGEHPDSTYGWECGSNCKKMDSSEIAPFECDETAQ